MAGTVEIVGLERLKAALLVLPTELRPPILREIARKPASVAAQIARRLFPYGDTGATVKTIGILKVKDQKQPFVAVGFRGRSLGYIYVSKSLIKRRNRGTIKGTPWLFHRAGDQIQGQKQVMKTDISKVLAKSLRKRGYAPTMRFV